MINEIHFGDCRDSLRKMAGAGIKVQTCVTSPPYFGLRDYGHAGQIGLEETPEQFIAELVEVFRCVRDVLADDGTLWVNIGDSYGKGKQLLMIPARLALALQADGWILRQDIIWHKPNPMPESVTDRCTKSHEYVFLLSKGPRYFYDAEAVKEPAVNTRKPGRKIRDTRETHGTGGGNAGINGLMARYHNGEAPTHRNRRTVWTIPTVPYKGAHFAVFPPALVEPCILAGSRPGDIVLDPFMGSGTTAAVAVQHGRQFIGCELNINYKPLQHQRIAEATTARQKITAQTNLFPAEAV